MDLDPMTMAYARLAQRTALRTHLSDPNVSMIDIGQRRRNGELEDELTIRFYVRQKLSPLQLQSRYDIQVLACDLSSGQTSILATGRQHLSPETLDYRSSLDFELPPVGSYQTIGIILLGDESALGSALGPTLTVIP